MPATSANDLVFDVVGLGALNMDHWYRVPSIELDGEQVIVDQGSSPGGSSANTIYALGRLGLKAAFIGVVGDDQAADEILSDFQRANVIVSGIARRQGKSGHTVCLVDKLAHRSIYVNAGVNNDLSDSDVNFTWLQKTKVLHISSFVGDAQLGLQIRIAQQLSKDVIFSFAPGALYCHRGLQSLAPILARADILFLNQAEISQLGGEKFEAAVQKLHQVGCRRIVVTSAGHDRLWFASDQDSEVWGTKKLLDALPIDDATGAGDAFAAGFLHGLISGKNLRTCGVLAQLVAEFCLSAHGPRIGLPPAEMLFQAFESVQNQDD
ncbi:carbohydrate kinase family protein [Chloroflexota bacterium]